MSATTKSDMKSSSNSKAVNNPSRNRWAMRVLMTLVWFVVGVIGIATLNGYASTGFTQVPDMVREIFGGMISPIPAPPKGYLSVTPGLLQQDISSGQDKYLGQDVAAYGKLLPWTDSSSSGVEDTSNVHVQPLQTRPDTVTIALYVDPTEHPEQNARPVTLVVRASEKWKKDHEALEGQWVQVLGTVVPYAPGNGEPSAEIQSEKIERISEPYDIYDHNLPMTNPLKEDD